MIYYLVTRPHAYTLAAFVQGWGKALAGRMLIAPYDALLSGSALPGGGVYVVGERIVPRHVFFSRDWLVKGADLRDPDYLAEELAYVRANPHAAALLEICRTARIGWGRVDYSLLDGRIQVWEINTNPLFVLPGIEDGHDEVHRLAALGIVGALLGLDRT